MLRKYSLEPYLTDHLSTGRFPIKSRWKSVTRNVINVHVSSAWISRVQGDMTLSCFLIIKPQLLKIIHIWKFSRLSHSQSENCMAIVNLSAKFYSDTFSNLCSVNRTIVSTCEHAIFDCPFTSHLIIRLLNIMHTHLGEANYNRFLSLSNNDKIVSMISGLNSSELTDENYSLIFSLTSALGGIWKHLQ